MPKIVEAIFSDEAYDAFMNGIAVDNNGLRSRNGCFYPDQPSFNLRSENDLKIENALVDIGIGAAVYGVFFIVLPNVKRFTDEKIYPYLSEKWDNWRKSKQESHSSSDNMSSFEDDDKVIPFGQGRRGA